MTVFLETLLQMNLTAGVVILAVLLARLLLRRFPRRFSYLLWAVVAFRLCVPVSLASPVSLFNIGDNELPAQRLEIETSVPEETVSLPVADTEQEAVLPVPETSVPAQDADVPQASLPQTEVPPQQAPSVGKPVTEEAPAALSPVAEAPYELPAWVLPVLWLAGVCAVLGYGILARLKAGRMMATAVRLEGNVYGSDRIGSPFAMGVFKPRIYIPFGLDEHTREYILAHERYHLRRLDHLVKLMAYGILAVHWFNPLCWLAFNRMSLDMELSCDEGVLAGYDDPAVKKRYSRALLSFAVNKPTHVPSPLSFSESASAKVRIKNALYWKKPTLWSSVLAAVLCLSLLLTCGFDPVAAEQGAEPTESPAEVLPPEGLPPEPEKPAPPQEITPPETVSRGLEYQLNRDGQSYTVASIGDCADEELHVPAYHEDGKPITAIGEYAFSGSTLLSVYLPDTVQEVREGAFQNSIYLQTARLPQNAWLGNGVFRYCESLEQVNLPAKLRSLPQQTFQGCVSLQELYLPEGLFLIGNYAMENCRSLKEIYIPDSVLNVQEAAFMECVSLESARVSPRAELDRMVFQGCISLQTVTLPKNLTSVPYQLFAQCVRLSWVELPHSVTYISPNAFLYCSSLKEIAIPGGVTGIGDNAFCDSGLTRIYLPDSVTYLGPHAFQTCDDLVSVRLPKTLKLLRRYTFHGCTSLKEIELPDSLESIEDNAFGMCTSLQSIVIPEKVTEIREFCFSGCTSLKEVVLPAHVKTVWNYAFSQCSNLETVTMEGVEKLSDLAFFHCGKLRTVTLPRSLRELGGQIFQNCSGLQEVIYEGTAAEWNAVDKQSHWWPDGGKVACSDGEING